MDVAQPEVLARRTVPRKAKLPGRARLSEVLGALSYALDLTEGQPPGHSLRCCWLAMHIGRTLDLPAVVLADLYYATLLKDAGCSSNAGRVWKLYGGGEDRLAKRDFSTVDPQSLLQIGRYVMRHAGGEALQKRMGRVVSAVGHSDELATDLIRTRGEQGAEIVRRIGFGEPVAAAICALDEHWNGQGRPRCTKGEAIPIIARIVLLAQVVEVFHAIDGPDAALREARHRAGVWFDPRVVAALNAAAAKSGFWEGLTEADLDERVGALEPSAHVVMIDEDRLDRVAEAFAAVIDAKSSFTSGHSERVSKYADAVAGELGWEDARRRWLRRAALLHDIGKLGVSNAILDKPGRLDEEQWREIKRHAEMSKTILRRSRVFDDLASIAGAQHERLDGTGYPRQLSGEDIPIEVRIITTADIFDALTADRPYRGPMPVPDALAVMQRDRGTAIDSDCLDALQRYLVAQNVAIRY